jgi:hypothetical protein
MTELRQRQPRQEDAGFLKFTRTLPCCVCGTIGMSQAAHIRMANASLKKPPSGMQEKPDDIWCVPLCGPRLGRFPTVIGCHAEQHAMNERDFWDRSGFDPFVIAAWNYASYRVGKPQETRSASQPRKPKIRAKVAARPRQPRRGPKAKIPSRPFPKGIKFRT